MILRKQARHGGGRSSIGIGVSARVFSPPLPPQLGHKRAAAARLGLSMLVAQIRLEGTALGGKRICWGASVGWAS